MAANLSRGAGPGPLSAENGVSLPLRSVRRCGRHPPSPPTARRRPRTLPAPRRGGRGRAGCPRRCLSGKREGAGRGRPGWASPAPRGREGQMVAAAGRGGARFVSGGEKRRVPTETGSAGGDRGGPPPRSEAEGTAGRGTPGQARAASPGKRRRAHGDTARRLRACSEGGSTTHRHPPGRRCPGARRLPRGRGRTPPRRAGNGVPDGEGRCESG
ncbi:myosin heavy chain IB-like [Phalacrocorax carbo]|uniref:myosin heavy chain IB-like n=1 Tax=Phalacrocorax carbo TaxID=9209 RepID=UPI003119C481